jgi:hypothetical protein
MVEIDGWVEICENFGLWNNDEKSIKKKIMSKKI